MKSKFNVGDLLKSNVYNEIAYISEIQEISTGNTLVHLTVLSGEKNYLKGNWFISSIECLTIDEAVVHYPIKVRTNEN